MGPCHRLKRRSMSCQFVHESMSSYLDNRLEESDRRSVAQHLEECGECSTQHGRMAGVRESLRSLPIVLAPERLAADLLILASKEVLRSRCMSSVSAWLQFWMGRAQLVIDNLMRPMALPFAGGLTSALFIFGTLVPYLGLLRNPANDKPTALYTEASVENVADLGSRITDDTLIEIQVDGQGRMVDYSVLQGQVTSDVGSFLLFATYTPATMFLQPTSGRIVIRRSRIVVKG